VVRNRYCDGGVTESFLHHDMAATLTYLNEAVLH